MAELAIATAQKAALEAEAAAAAAQQEVSETQRDIAKLLASAAVIDVGDDASGDASMDPAE